MRNHDLNFLKHFSMVIVALVVVTIALILFAMKLHGGKPSEPDRTRMAAVEARIAPVSGVYAGDTGAAAMAAAAEAAREAAAGQVAYDGTLDGAVIYNALCGSCHNSGAGGAPLMTEAAWAPRIAKGMETLVQNAIDGYQGEAGIMPARGGNPALTDEQIDATVRWMLDNLE